MSVHVFLDALRLLAVIYLLALAGAAALGMHRSLLAYPFHAGYAFVRLALLALTLGRVHLSQDWNRTRMRQSRRVRNLRAELADWRERRAEQRAIRRGEDPYAPAVGWTSANDTASAPPTPAPPMPPASQQAHTPASPPPAPSAPTPPPTATPQAPAAGRPPAPTEDDVPPNLW